MSTGAESRVGSFVWHELLSTDVESAKSFYTGLFGWGIEVWKPGELDYAMISVDGAMHGGFWKQEQAGAPSQWLGHVYVEDVDEAARRASSLGGSVLLEPMDMPEVGRFATIRDPYGGVLSAFRPDPSASGGSAEGVLVWDELMSADAEGATRFYTEVFGWTARVTEGLAGPYTMLQRAGGIDVAGLMQKPDDMPASLWIPYVAAGDVDATVGRAGELGGRTLMPGTDIPEAGRIAVLADPTGAVFGLFRPAAG